MGSIYLSTPTEMFDFRLKVFLTVAQRLSFTKAAKELYISQPAVTKHVKEIEKHYRCNLFERNGPKISLTPQGEVVVKYAEKIHAIHQEMEAKLIYFEEVNKGIIKIGSSTTAAQYLLPKYLAEFNRLYPSITLELMTSNTETIENQLLDKKIDLGIVEGKSQRNPIVYKPLQKDEIVLCTHVGTKVKPVLSVDEIHDLRFVMREKGSGTREIIAAALQQKKVKISDLSVDIILENNESIKNYLRSSTAFAFISISAVLNELKANQLKIIDVDGMSMERFFYLIGRKEERSATHQLFEEYLLNNNF